jgi:hypothetical protein
MAIQPTIYVIASDAHRNGKTLLARLIVDYLLLDGRDPFLIDTDAPDGPLRTFFPGRTVLADFAAITGQMKAFDTILAAPGRDYVVDIPARFTEVFFAADRDLKFFYECRKAGFRVFLFFVVDDTIGSLKSARAMQHYPNVDLFVPVRNLMLRSQWAEEDGAMSIPYLPAPIAAAVGNRRFSFRAFVQGDTQNLPPEMIQTVQDFLYETLSNLSNLEPAFSLKQLKR